MKTLFAASLAAVAGLGAAASAQSVTWTPGLEGFGGSDAISSNEVMVWTETFSLGAVMSFDSIDMDIAHDYAGDLTLRLTNNDTGTSYYFFGTEGSIGTDPGIADGDSIFDSDGLGTSPYGLADTASYTLVESGAGTTFITDTSGDIAAGTYDAQGWASGSFAAASWTIELWDTWGSSDAGSLASLTINYTGVPAPASAALLGLGGFVATRRRR